MAALCLTGLLLAAVVIVEGRSLLFFRSLTPWSAPERMELCGRTFIRASLVPAVRAEEPLNGVPLRQMGRGPLWQPVYGHPPSATYQRRGVPCTMELYLREGDGYRGYSLTGGP